MAHFCARLFGVCLYLFLLPINLVVCLLGLCPLKHTHTHTQRERGLDYWLRRMLLKVLLFPDLAMFVKGKHMNK